MNIFSYCFDVQLEPQSFHIQIQHLQIKREEKKLKNNRTQQQTTAKKNKRKYYINL